MNKHITIAGLLMLALNGSATADDAVPTFNLKNKNVHSPIILVVHPRDDASTKRMRITSQYGKRGKIEYDGPYNPSQPIWLANSYDGKSDTSFYDISFYDLHNLAGVDIFYERNGVMVDHVLFNDVTKDTTYYVKYNLREGLMPQEGVSEKVFGKKSKTTAGYSLAHNVTDKNITQTVGKPSKVLQGKPLPHLDFTKAMNDFHQLSTEYMKSQWIK